MFKSLKFAYIIKRKFSLAITISNVVEVLLEKGSKGTSKE